MTPERVAALQDMGFVFDPRANRKSTTPTAEVVGSMQGSQINPSNVDGGASSAPFDPISGNEKHDDDGDDVAEGGQYFV